MSSCNTCAKPFGFFNKELGCPRCKFTYCKKCLNHKIQDPNNSKKQINCCLKCSRLQQDTKTLSKKLQKEQIEELLRVDKDVSDPILEPVPSSSSADDIRYRLDALKKDRIPEDVQDQNIDDIHKRLANLKGVEHKDYSTQNKVIFAKDTRSEQEKVDDLLKQFVDEKTIDDTNPVENPTVTIEDIERRLAALRGQDLSKIKAQVLQIELTDEEEAENVVKKYLDEVKLDDIVLDEEQEFLSSIPPPPDGRKLDELPFCELCNEDATLRCLECENLFCNSCFKEFHYEEDYRNHPTQPYRASKSDDNI